MNKNIFWAYNTTFNYYHQLPLAGKRAEEFIEKNNKSKGGRWVLHTPEQYDEWYKHRGQFFDTVF